MSTQIFLLYRLFIFVLLLSVPSIHIRTLTYLQLTYFLQHLQTLTYTFIHTNARAHTHTHTHIHTHTHTHTYTHNTIVFISLVSSHVFQQARSKSKTFFFSASMAAGLYAAISSSTPTTYNAASEEGDRFSNTKLYPPLKVSITTINPFISLQL